MSHLLEENNRLKAEVQRLQERIAEMADWLTIEMYVTDVFDLRPCEDKMLRALMRSERVSDETLRWLLSDYGERYYYMALADLRAKMASFGIGVLRIGTDQTFPGWFINSEGKAWLREIVLCTLQGVRASKKRALTSKSGRHSVASVSPRVLDLTPPSATAGRVPDEDPAAFNPTYDGNMPSAPAISHRNGAGHRSRRTAPPVEGMGQR